MLVVLESRALEVEKSLLASQVSLPQAPVAGGTPIADDRKKPSAIGDQRSARGAHAGGSEARLARALEVEKKRRWAQPIPRI
jgi:hypothetical protein